MAQKNRLGRLVPQMLLNWEITHAKVAKVGKFECGPTSLSLGKPR
jgi:hypothetical protein